MNDTEKQAATRAASFISGILTGWGVPAAWAKAITGAVIGAAIGTLIACGCLTSCTPIQTYGSAAIPTLQNQTAPALRALQSYTTAPQAR